MRTSQVAVDPQVFDDFSGMTTASEKMLVHAFVAKPADEAFHEALLHRPAGRDVVPFVLALLFQATNQPASDARLPSDQSVAVLPGLLQTACSPGNGQKSGT